MKRSALALALLCALVGLGCPGQRPAVQAGPKVQDGAPQGPLVWRVSKSGLGFRLSNGEDEADRGMAAKPAPTIRKSNGASALPVRSFWRIGASVI